MRYRKLFIVSILINFISINPNLIAQDLTPKKDKALINLLLVNEDEQPQKADIKFFSSKTGSEFSVTTNAEGKASILLPVVDKYKVDVGDFKNYDELEISNEEFQTLNYKYYYEEKKNETLLKVTLHTSDNKPLIEEVEIVNDKTGEKIILKTNAQGIAEATIPSNAFYIVNLTNAPHYEDFEIPDADNLEYHLEIVFEGSHTNKLFPSKTMALIKFHYLDLDSIGVPDEKLLIHSEKSIEFYEVTTNEQGFAEILVPIGDIYHFSAKHWRDFIVDTVPNYSKLYERSINLTYISSKEYERRDAERIRLARLNDAKAIFNPEPDINKYIDKSKETLESTTLEIRNSIKTDSLYFEKKKFNVNAVLYRLRNKWKNKIIVTDVTCSMQPYVMEVLQWHILKLIADESNQYIFFNDGNGMPNELKKIGLTGGFHYTNADNIDSLLTKLHSARQYGCSGDAPENDLEALLEAKQYMKSKCELILIADNYSPVRDMELLKELDMPVHVILCGLDVYVHEHYLEIAHKTKGSVHTIYEDIENLSKVTEGERIKISGHVYLYTKGRFVLIR